MLPILHLGPLAIQTPGLILLLGGWFGLFLINKISPRYAFIPNSFEANLLISFGIGLVGARLAYFFFYPELLYENFLNLFSLNLTMFMLPAGLLLFLVTYYRLNQKRGISLSQASDVLTLWLSVFLVALFLSWFASGEYFGLSTSLPWGIFLWGELRHPVQIYGALGAGVTTLILFRYFLPKITVKYSINQGIFTVIFSIFTSSYVLFFDGFSQATPLLFGAIHAVQVVAWVTLAVSLYVFRKRFLAQLFGGKNGKSNES